MKLVALLIGTVFSMHSYEPWTWTYRFTNPGFDTDRALVVKKIGVPSFSQLICSWNCSMPSQGYFSFFVQVCDEKTGRWSEWIHMADWGAGVKKTYLYKSKSSALGYHYVRFELGSAKANAFKIKVLRSPECDTQCSALNVCVSDLDKMQPEQSHKLSLKSCSIVKVPFLSQFHIDHPKNDALCSPTSCTMLLRYYLGKDFDPAVISEQLYDEGLGIYGSWPCNMAGVYSASCGRLSACVTRLDNFEVLHRYLMRSIPVCVSVRGPLAGSATPYASGHILIVKGFDAHRQEVICNDPAFEHQDDRGTRYPLQDFLNAWERSKRLAYIVIPQEKLKK